MQPSGVGTLNSRINIHSLTPRFLLSTYVFALPIESCIALVWAKRCLVLGFQMEGCGIIIWTDETEHFHVTGSCMHALAADLHTCTTQPERVRLTPESTGLLGGQRRTTYLARLLSYLRINVPQSEIGNYFEVDVLCFPLPTFVGRGRKGVLEGLRTGHQMVLCTWWTAMSLFMIYRYWFCWVG